MSKVTYEPRPSVVKECGHECYVTRCSALPPFNILVDGVHEPRMHVECCNCFYEKRPEKKTTEFRAVDLRTDKDGPTCALCLSRLHANEEAGHPPPDASASMTLP